MRYPETFKQFLKILPFSVLGSLFLLLGACAELSTPTSPASNSNVQAAAPTAPATTAVQFAAPPPTATEAPPTVNAIPTATAIPTSTPAPTLTSTPIPPTATSVPTATATATAVPPTATKVPPTATRIPPTTKVVPTPGLADSKGDGVGVSILAVNGNIPGKGASVTIQTGPSVECAIEYKTPAGQTSVAKGLEPKISDLNGRITWNWTIGTTTKAGKGSVKVTCGDSSETRQITIG